MIGFERVVDDKFIDSIVNDSPELKNIYKKDRTLKKRLRVEADKAYLKNKRVIRGAELVDRIDLFMGPLEAGVSAFGPPGIAVEKVLDGVELVGKGLYGIYYARSTGKNNDDGKFRWDDVDLEGILGWGVMEGAAAVLPGGDLLDIKTIYKDRAKVYLKKQITKDFLRKESLSGRMAA